MSDSEQPQRWQPTRLPRPWDSPGKNTGVGCHFPLQRMKEKSESEVTQSCPTLRDPIDCSLPGSSIHGFPSKSTGVGWHCLLHLYLWVTWKVPFMFIYKQNQQNHVFPFHSVEWKSWKPRKEKFLSKQSVIRKFDPSLLFRNLVFVL